MPRSLRRIRRILRGWRLVLALLALPALAIVLWLGFGLADAAAAFEAPARVAITGVLASLMGVVAPVALWRAWRVSAQEAARRADAVRGDVRQPALAALSLDAERATTPLAKFLTARALDEASVALGKIPARSLLPWRSLAFALGALLLPLAGLGGLRLAQPEAFATVANRLRHPGADIPPHTRLVFVLSPEKPAVVYGSGLTLSAEISGDKLAHPVECLVRRVPGGETLRLPAFREAPGRFSRELDSLTEPVEVAFACGKARSKWRTVEILLEPNILGGEVRVRPPHYTRLAEFGIPLDSNEIAVIEGSQVILELDSNRPLGSASLELTPANLPGTESEPETIAGRISATHRASFTWTATRSGKLTASVRDIRGTPAPRPLQLAFRCVPDKPPSVVLDSPPADLLATPGAVVGVSGHASDDFALSKIYFVRTLAGFRDRSRLVASGLEAKSRDFSTRLDLKELGLLPGQVIELMLNASDHNPSLLGQGSSEISRIRVISEEQYARLIRLRTSLDEFSARFQAARDAIREARAALDELEKSVHEGEADTIARAARAAAEAHGKSAELLELMARDFPAYELENRLKELAEKQAGILRENQAGLEQLDPTESREELLRRLEVLRERLGREREAGRRLERDAELVRQAGLLLEMATEFRRIYESQENLAKRFGVIVGELRQGNDQNRRQLPLLAETQLKNHQALEDFKVELERRIEAAPAEEPALGELLGAAIRFFDDLVAAEPETLMTAAARAGQAGSAGEAFANAERARALLERFLNREDDAFAAAARGRAPEFRIPDLDSTLAQLLEGLLGQKTGQGDPSGLGTQPGLGPGGTGFGSNGLAGERGDGHTMQNLPMVGPERLHFGPSPVPGRGGGGESPPGPGSPLPEAAETGRIEPGGERDGEAPAPSPESIPEAYREAVRKFQTR